MLLEVIHTTRFAYSSKIAETVMEVRARPLDGLGQRCLEFELAVEPESRVSFYRDGFGNFVHYFNHLEPHQEILVRARSVVETGIGPDAHTFGFPEDFLLFREPVVEVAGVRKMAARFRPAAGAEGAEIEASLDALALHINRKFRYVPETTDVYTGVKQVLELKSGVCQDFAHLFLAVGRSMGIPCRYVSGYIMSGEGRVGTGASHAWAEAWIPGRGWVGYDPTNPVKAGEQHVRVAVGRDYRDVAPTRGVYLGSAEEIMGVAVSTRFL